MVIGCFFPSLINMSKPLSGSLAIGSIALVPWILSLHFRFFVSTRPIYANLPFRPYTLMYDNIVIFGVGVGAWCIAMTKGMSGSSLPLIYAMAACFLTPCIFAFLRRSSMFIGFLPMFPFVLGVVVLVVQRPLVEAANAIPAWLLISGLIVSAFTPLVLRKRIFKNWRRLLGEGMYPYLDLNGQKASRRIYQRDKNEAPRQFREQAKQLADYFFNASEALPVGGYNPWSFRKNLRLYLTLLVTLAVVTVMLFTLFQDLPLSQRENVVSISISIALFSIVVTGLNRSLVKDFISRIGRVEALEVLEKIIRRSSVSMVLFAVTVILVVYLCLALVGIQPLRLSILHQLLNLALIVLITAVPWTLWSFSAGKNKGAFQATGRAQVYLIVFIIWYSVSNSIFSELLVASSSKLKGFLSIEIAVLTVVAIFSYCWMLPAARRKFLNGDY